MKRQTIIVLAVVFSFSLACQFLAPSQRGMVISNCADLVSAVADLQVGDIPDHLLETGKKQGDEFDPNQYFNVLTHLSMRDGFSLDYIYQTDDLGAYPLLLPRKADQSPYTSFADVPKDLQSADFHDYLEIEDTEQGYFEYVVMDIMASQFYLSWHANYNDNEIVCNRQEVDDIVSRFSTSDFGNAMNLAQQTKARAIRNVEPTVSLTGDVAKVQVITFTKWGGFYRLTYTINRGLPHTITNVQSDNLVPYDCGVMF